MTNSQADKSALERALEVGVYAPLGYLLTRSRTRPELIAAGRKQIAFSRSLGRAALKGMARGRRGSSNSAAGSNPKVENPGVAKATVEMAPVKKVTVEKAKVDTANVEKAKVEATLSAGIAEHSETDHGPAAKAASAVAAPAAIDGYDSMTAKDIIALANSATSEQLTWIGTHEESNKQRITVLRAVAKRLHHLRT